MRTAIQMIDSTPAASGKVGDRGAQTWVARVAADKRQGHPDGEFEKIGRLSRIVVDEVGYIPFSPEAAMPGVS